jgi:hypothetical protein
MDIAAPKVSAGANAGWHLTGGAIADIIPNKAERAEVNERTSNLPTFSDVGQSLKQNLGQNNPKDIGRAIDRNTPGAL